MGFQLSPAVVVTEKDLTNRVPAVSTSTGAFAGAFAWGPVLDPYQITSENNLVSVFGKPKSDNANGWFTAANFLAYSNNLWVCRADCKGQENAKSEAYDTQSTLTEGVRYRIATLGTTDWTDYGAIAGQESVGDVFTASVSVVSPSSITGGGTVTKVFVVKNDQHYDDNFADGSGEVGAWAARYAGTLGNSIKVAIADSNCFAEGTDTIADNALVIGQRYKIVTPTVATDWSDAASEVYRVVNGILTSVSATTAVAGDIFTATATDANSSGTVVAAKWEYADQFDAAPSDSPYSVGINNGAGTNDEVHVIVVDALGRFTGVPGTILEKFPFLSKASDAKRGDGTNIFYKEYINRVSKYIYWMDFPSNLASSGDAWGSETEGTTFKNLLSSEPVVLSGGADDLSVSTGALIEAWEIFADAERFDISLLPAGAAKPYVANAIIQNVCEVRKDCVAFISPTVEVSDYLGEGVLITGNDILNDTLDFRNDNITSSSYGVADSGWKKQFDQYADIYRWVPLNGDTAGLCARTDDTNDPWFSPAGLNRGQIKNVAKLSFSPNKAQRDELFKIGINPVVSLKGQGVVLFGDKTLLSRPSAFDHINVRRLFIVLEKAIATAAKYQLFEFNDAFTRAQFRSMTEPFLRDVQGRRGIFDFRVVCDESNNTGEIIDNNQFVGDIYIKPARSINEIHLNFVAVRTDVSFDEIGA